MLGAILAPAAGYTKNERETRKISAQKYFFIMLFSETQAIGFLREIIECAIGVSTIFDAYPGFVLSDVNGFELCAVILLAK